MRETSDDQRHMQAYIGLSHILVHTYVQCKQANVIHLHANKHMLCIIAYNTCTYAHLYVYLQVYTILLYLYSNVLHIVSGLTLGSFADDFLLFSCVFCVFIFMLFSCYIFCFQLSVFMLTRRESGLSPCIVSTDYRSLFEVVRS